MIRRSFLRAVVAPGLLAGALPRAAGAQPGKVLRVGILSPFDRAAGAGPAFTAFRERLGDLGLVEGSAATFEYRWADDRLDRLPQLAVELARAPVDVIVSTWGTPAALAARDATKAIPIVFIAAGGAVSIGLIASFARPGGNVTGSTFRVEEVANKQLQLLREVAPKVSRVGVLFNPANPVYNPVLRSLESIGREMGVRVVRLGVRDPDELDGAFDGARRERADGLLVLRDSVLLSQRERVLNLAARLRLPAMYGTREFVDGGGLLALEPSVVDLYRRAADLVAKIARGARPADLPVELSSRLDLAVNLRTAQVLGLTISKAVLARASHVVE